MEQDSVFPMNPVTLTISIPKVNHYDMQSRYHINKELLVYLESPTCRKYMTESERRVKLKSATERFRNILLYKTFNPF
jgi:hypothetical protein